MKALHHLLSYTLAAGTLLGMLIVTPASAASSASFQWLANPSDENVLGYRLYFGTESRFTSDNTPKQDFTYSKVIDLSNGIICEGQGYQLCKSLEASQLQCENLYSDNPQCTLYDLSGRLFFAMTAYSSAAESAYTPELEWGDAQIVAFQEVIKLLLLDE